MAKVEVPITGAVLSWAIKEGGHSVESFATAMSTSSRPVEPARVRAWITGEELPGKGDLERMANKLKRPTAMFLLPRPPKRGVQPSLRKARGPGERALTPDEQIQVRWVLRLQDLVRELVGKQAVELPHLPDADPGEAASRVRAWLDISTDTQTSWRERRVAFHSWQESLETKGVHVLQLQLGADGIRGFSSWDPAAPIIAVNNSADPDFRARTFSLFHELGHLVRRDNAACGQFDRRSKSGERWCDRFAGAFLLPKEDVIGWLRSWADGPVGRVGDLETVRRLARTFKVSLRATAMRLVDLDYADQDLYDTVERTARPSPSRSNRPGGATTAQRRERELGARLVKVFLRARRTEGLSDLEIADYLRMPYTQLPDLASAVGEPT